MLAVDKRSTIGALITSCALLLAGVPLANAESRTPIELSARERERLAAGMRVYFECVDGITNALADSKMAGVSRSAQRCGMGMVEDVSLADVFSLPPAFLAMSLDTHQKFDALAQEAAGQTSKARVLKQLGAIVANCTACHAAYRFGR